ncbi:MAG: TOBE domain-containing protein, partial [Pseudomonadota bacterium]
ANKGIAQVGTPLDLYERPENEFVAQFIGSPAMNLLPGEIVETGDVTRVHLASGHGTIAAHIKTQQADKGLSVNVGIRPEDMTVTEGDDFAFEGEVEIVEALGEVTQVYFRKEASGSPAVIGKLQGIHAGLRGKNLKMTVNPEKVHLFSNGHSLLYR